MIKSILNLIFLKITIIMISSRQFMGLNWLFLIYLLNIKMNWISSIITNFNIHIN